MIFYSIFQTPIGEAAIVFRRQPFAVLQTVFTRPDRGNLAKYLKAKIGGTPGADKKVLVVSALIVDYFKGKPIAPPWEWMDLSTLTRLQRLVLQATADIPYGQLKSYQAVAEAIGRPRAYRFVGTTLANNPFPILIPCHRVIRKSGALGRFGGGADLKKRLIELEARAGIFGAL